LVDITMRAPLALVAPSLLLPLLLLVVETAAQPHDQQQQLGAEPTAHDNDRPEPPTIAARQNLFKPTKATPLYRIPALAVLNASHVVAFAEARDKHVRIVAKVSTDGGATFGPEQAVVSEQGQKIGNPAPVVLDGSDGRVLLVYCRNNLKMFAVNLTLDASGELQIAPSREITADVLRGIPLARFIASGPPGGIRSASGRIVVACDFTPKQKSSSPVRLRSAQSSDIRSFVIHSDDNGLHWQHTGLLPVSANFSTSENQCASADGGKTIITTARTGSTNPQDPTAENFRAVAVSRDGGDNFGAFQRTNIADPTCEGSTLGLEATGEYWMSSGIAAVPGNRSNVSLSVCDAACAKGGFVTWRPVLVVDPGLSSYSSLGSTNAETLLLLYEVGGGESITALSLVTIKLAPPTAVGSKKMLAEVEAAAGAQGGVMQAKGGG
jgi:sialidase-1